jgi:hypothetical protein
VTEVPAVVPDFPSDDAHAYPVTAFPPLLLGADQETLSLVAPATLVGDPGFGLETVGADGAVGTVVAVIELDSLEAKDDPALLVATTLNV